MRAMAIGLAVLSACADGAAVEVGRIDRDVIRIGNGVLTTLAGAVGPDGRTYAIADGLLERNGFHWREGAFDPTGWQFSSPEVESRFYARVVTPWTVCYDTFAAYDAATPTFVSSCVLAKVNDVTEMEILMLTDALTDEWRGPVDVEEYPTAAHDITVRGDLSREPPEIYAAIYAKKPIPGLGAGLFERMLGRQSVDFHYCDTYHREFPNTTHVFEDDTLKS